MLNILPFSNTTESFYTNRNKRPEKHLQQIKSKKPQLFFTLFSPCIKSGLSSILESD